MNDGIFIQWYQILYSCENGEINQKHVDKHEYIPRIKHDENARCQMTMTPNYSLYTLKNMYINNMYNIYNKYIKYL